MSNDDGDVLCLDVSAAIFRWNGEQAEDGLLTRLIIWNHSEVDDGADYTDNIEQRETREKRRRGKIDMRDDIEKRYKRENIVI